VFEPLDATGVELTGDHGGNEQGRVIPVEKPLLGHHLRPFQLQILYSMGSMKRPGVNPLVIDYSGGHRGDDIRCANGFLEVELAPPCMLNNSVSVQRTQAPVLWAAFTVFLKFLLSFCGL
jgi:hypothetical protein